MHPARRRHRRRRVIPRPQQLRPLRPGQHRHLRQPPPGSAATAASTTPRCPASRAIRAPRRTTPCCTPPPRPARRRPRPAISRRSTSPPRRRRPGPGPARRPGPARLPAIAGGEVVEQHLEQRRPGPVPVGHQLVDQLLERQVLMRVRGQRLARTRPSSSANVGSPDRSVRSTSVLTKNPIRPSISARFRSAIGVPTTTSSWPAVPAQQHAERRQHRHEHRRPGRPAQPPAARAVTSAGTANAPPPRRSTAPPAAAGPPAAPAPAPRPAAPASTPAARPAPPRPATRRCHTAKSAYCTGSGGSPSGSRPAPRMQRRQLAAQDRRRPLVADHVMQRTAPAHAPRRRAAPAPPGTAARRPGRTAPPHPRRPARAPPRPGRPGRTRPPPAARTADGGSITCYGTPSGARDQPGPQHLMPGHQPRPAPRPAPPRPRRRQPHRQRHVVLRRARLELVQEPQPLLRERQRQRPAPRRRGHRRQHQAPRCSLDHLGQARHRRLVEQRRQRHLSAERLPHPRHHPGRQQRMPAQLEELSRTPTRSTPSTCAQTPASSSCAARRRRHVPAQPSRPPRRLGQRRPVHLPVTRQRQRRQLHEHRRDHVIRQ